MWRIHIKIQSSGFVSLHYEEKNVIYVKKREKVCTDVCTLLCTDNMQKAIV